MKSRSLRFWLLGSHAVVLVLTMASLLATGALATDLRKQTKAELMNEGAVLQLWLETEMRDDPDTWLADHATELSGTLASLKATTLAGIRVLDATGHVVASSGAGTGDDPSNDPEVQAALRGEQGEAIRDREHGAAYTLEGPSRAASVRMFVALPLRAQNRVVGVVLLSRTPWGEVQALYHMAPRLMLGAIAALFVTAGIAISAGLVGTRSLKRLAAASQQLSQGSFAVQSDLDRAARSHVREVAELGETMSAMRERLEARLHYITEFASAVSHEFKTPLSTLRGTMELLGDDPDMPADQRARFLDNALTDLHRMDRLVHGLLELARAEEKPEIEQIDLDPLLERVAHEADASFAGGAGRVRGNPTQLETVARNLIENARRHGKAQHVSIRAFANETTGFEIEDDGVGISEANQAQVFDRFFTTDRDGGGTGLGLSLVRTIVRSHGGTVSLESSPGRTRFRVSLPRLD